MEYKVLSVRMYVIVCTYDVSMYNGKGGAGEVGSPLTADQCRASISAIGAVRRGGAYHITRPGSLPGGGRSIINLASLYTSTFGISPCTYIPTYRT